MSGYGSVNVIVGKHLHVEKISYSIEEDVNLVQIK